jgi:hypothetical protein
MHPLNYSHLHADVIQSAYITALASAAVLRSLARCCGLSPPELMAAAAAVDPAQISQLKDAISAKTLMFLSPQ